VYGLLVGAAFHEVQKLNILCLQRFLGQAHAELVETLDAGAEAIDGEHGRERERGEKGASEERSPLARLGRVEDSREPVVGAR
jgi:hypothetical protein